MLYFVLILSTGIINKYLNYFINLPGNYQTYGVLLAFLLFYRHVMRSDMSQLAWIRFQRLFLTYAATSLVILLLETCHYITSEKYGINVLRSIFYCFFFGYLGTLIRPQNLNLRKIDNIFMAVILWDLVFSELLPVAGYSSQIVYVALSWCVISTVFAPNWIGKRNIVTLYLVLIASAIFNTILGVVFSFLIFYVSVLTFTNYSQDIFSYRRYVSKIFIGVFLTLIAAIFINAPLLDVISYSLETGWTIVTYGLRPEDYLTITQLDSGILGQITSSYIRNKATITSWSSFVENPFLGIGSEAVKNQKFFGYYTHVYWIFLLASYGIFALFILFWFYTFPLIFIEGRQLYVLVFYFSTLITFTAEFYPAISVMLGLFACNSFKSTTTEESHEKS
jgi:hypothetical protein